MAVSDLYTKESWEQAKQIVSVVGAMPGSLSSCIRLLRKDAEQSSNKLSPLSRYALRHLLRSPSVRACVYYYTLTSRVATVSDPRALSERDLLSLIPPGEMSVVLGLIYLFRKIRRGCDAEEFQAIAQRIYSHSGFGVWVGQAIEAIGPIFGLLSGSMRHLAGGLFLGIDKKNFIEYRRALKRSQRPFDMQEEMKLWGCTHAQVASLLSQSAGLGIGIGDALAWGFSAESANATSFQETNQAAAVRVAWSWIESLSTNGKPPDVVHSAQFYPLAQDLQQLLNQSQQAVRDGSPHAWLSRGRDDISRELTPGLFEPAHAPLPEEMAHDVPKEVLQEITKEDLSEIEE